MSSLPSELENCGSETQSLSDDALELDDMKCKLADRLSPLPNEILVSIVSLLSLKEAVRTCILSQRWRNLWTFTRTLDFHYSDKSDPDIVASFGKRSGSSTSVMLLPPLVRLEVRKSGKLPLVERPRLIEWVNHVLCLHKGSTIQDFLVSCELCGRIKEEVIDKWVEFALEKRVKRLKMDFKGMMAARLGNYPLTKPLLCKFNLSLLMMLHLKEVEVTSEAVHYVLSECPNLEELRVERSYSLVELNIPGPRTQLKCLEIKGCQNLKNLEIHAINIKSFAYHGFNIPVTFEKVPHLVDASFGDHYASFFVTNIEHFSSYISHLESLVLDLTIFCRHLIYQSFPEFPNLENLKQLELILGGIGLESIIDCCASFMMTCPGLVKLLLKAAPKHLAYSPMDWNRNRRDPDCLNRSIRVFELPGFNASEEEAEIACSLVSSLPSLEQVIVHLSEEITSQETEYTPKKVIASYKQIKLMLPPKAKLIMLP